MAQRGPRMGSAPAWQLNKASLLRVTVATGFIWLRPGPACDAVGKEQPEGKGALGSIPAATAWDAGCGPGMLLLCPCKWPGHSPAFPCPVRALIPPHPILAVGRLYGGPAKCFLLGLLGHPEHCSCHATGSALPNSGTGGDGQSQGGAWCLGAIALVLGAFSAGALGHLASSIPHPCLCCSPRLWT